MRTLAQAQLTLQHRVGGGGLAHDVQQKAPFDVEVQQRMRQLVEGLAEKRDGDCILQILLAPKKLGRFSDPSAHHHREILQASIICVPVLDRRCPLIARESEFPCPPEYVVQHDAEAEPAKQSQKTTPSEQQACSASHSLRPSTILLFSLSLSLSLSLCLSLSLSLFAPLSLLHDPLRRTTTTSTHMDLARTCTCTKRTRGMNDLEES